MDAGQPPPPPPPPGGFGPNVSPSPAMSGSPYAIPHHGNGGDLPRNGGDTEVERYHKSAVVPLSEVADDGCSFGTCILPTLVFLSFFGNFVYSEIGLRVVEYDTLFTGPPTSLVIWIIVYVLEFVFALYQLFFPRPRNSRLVQKKISVPFILHQVVGIFWLVALNQNRMYAATVAITLMWFLTLLIFSLISVEFRLGAYRFYGLTDYCLIEIPFAVLLGWETFTLIHGWNMFVVKLGFDAMLSESDFVSAQMVALILSFCAVMAAAILFAGLPLLMDPFIHIPLLWGISTVSWRWLRLGYQRASHLMWASDAIVEGVGVAAAVIAVVTFLFFVIAAALLGSSRLWMGYEEEDGLDGSSTSSSHSSHQRGASRQRQNLAPEQVL